MQSECTGRSTLICYVLFASVMNEQIGFKNKLCKLHHFVKLDHQ